MTQEFRDSGAKIFSQEFWKIGIDRWELLLVE